MKNISLNAVLASLVLCVSSVVNVANAGIITHGHLTTDDATDFITDTTTGRLYKRFDAFSLTQDETFAAIGVGGIFEGWSIASSVEADEFYAAVLGLGTTPCDGLAPNGTKCGQIRGWKAGDFGLSLESSGDWDGFAHSKSDVRDIGHGHIYSWGGVIDSESWAGRHKTTDMREYNYLLYKNASVEVPEPSTLAIFALGIIGLASRRFKKQS